MYFLSLLAAQSLGSNQGGDDCTARMGKCWFMFQHAHDVLRIEYGRGKGPISPEKREAHCIAYRTLLQCIARNMSTLCVGDLNYHSVKKGLETQMKTYNCSRNGTVVNDTDPRPPSTDDPRVCTYKGPANHRHCSLFGDPHLWMFTSQVQTCRILGAWPLVDNEFFTVQVTNGAVGAASAQVTTTTKVSLWFIS